MSKRGDLFWKLYREERRKFGPFKLVLSSHQITHAARQAAKRLPPLPDEPSGGGLV